MEKLQNSQIEEIIDRFKNNVESEKHLVEALGLRPCFILKKTEKSKVFGDLHHHDLYEILYIKEGKVSYIIEDKKYVLEEGDLILISPTMLHKLDKILTFTWK